MTTDKQTVHKIVAVKRNFDGDLEMFKLDNGMILNYDQAVQATEIGLLPGYNVGRNRSGEKVLRSNRDDNPDNNLQDLPNF